MARPPLDFYADPDSGSWQEIGYEPYPAGRPAADTPLVQRPPARALADLRERYDATIVGSGAGGGVTAFVLSESGASVLVVERGDWIGARELPIDHIRNHRYYFGGDLDTPPGHPRAVSDGGTEIAVDPEDMRYHHHAITVGGGTRFFGAQAWRFLPDDFRMASLYGVPDGSALADWPISYADLEPFYDRVEWEVGVAGRAHVDEGFRSRDYPMAPFPLTAEASMLAGGPRHSAGRPALCRC